MIDPNRRFKLSVHTGFCNKQPLGDTQNFATGFLNKLATYAEIKATVQAGHALCAQVGGRRRTADFIASDLLCVDIDVGMTVDDALNNPFVRAHAAFVYTTASHTAAHPRLRVVSLLERTIEDAAEQKAAMRGAALRLGGDLSATDPVRIFFGNTGAQFYDIGNLLSPEMGKELVAQGSRPPQPDRDKAGVTASPSRSALTFGPEQTVYLANGTSSLVSEAPHRSTVHCPYHDDRRASAMIVTNRRGVRGIFCSTCGQTYWPRTAREEFDFNSFSRACREASQQWDGRPKPPPLDDWPPPPVDVKTLSRCNVILTTKLEVRREHLAHLTFIKSPKGSGKTEVVAHLTSDADVLLITHRRALSRQSSKRLGLVCYLDTPNCDRRFYGTKRFCVCLDSVEKIDSSRPYLVILDECEQLISHFLSDTMADCWGAFVHFRNLLRNATSIIALDADLSWLSFATLTRCIARPSDPTLVQDTTSEEFVTKSVAIIINEPPTAKGHIYTYESDADLTGELKASVAAGKRCFVACNARWRAETLFLALRAEFPNARLLLITSDTVGEVDVVQFIADASTRALEYQVIVVSPSLGTGVDITFPDRASLIDDVFGFCDPLITTHFDFDQQIARVRQPRTVRVWVTPRTFHFETNADAVERHVLENSLFKNVLLDYTSDGRPVYAPNDPFIDMAVLITVPQRASKNNLRANFTRHKQEQGFTIENVPRAPGLSSDGRSLLAAGSALRKELIVTKMLTAGVLRRPEFRRLRRLFEAEEFVTLEERCAITRTRMELFYRQRLTEGLVQADRDGKLRREVRAFEQVLVLDKEANAFLRDVGDPEGLCPLLDQLPRGMRFVRHPTHTRIVLRNILLRTPFFREDGFQPSAEVSHADLGAFAAFVKQNKGQVENVLEMEVRGDVVSKPMQQLNVVLRKIGLKAVKVSTRNDGSDKVYGYKLDASALDLMKGIVAVRQATKPWDALYHLYGWEPEPDEDDGYGGYIEEEGND